MFCFESDSEQRIQRVVMRERGKGQGLKYILRSTCPYRAGPHSKKTAAAAHALLHSTVNSPTLVGQGGRYLATGAPPSHPKGTRA